MVRLMRGVSFNDGVDNKVVFQHRCSRLMLIFTVLPTDLLFHPAQVHSLQGESRTSNREEDSIWPRATKFSLTNSTPLKRAQLNLVASRLSTNLCVRSLTFFARTTRKRRSFEAAADGAVV